MDDWLFANYVFKHTFGVIHKFKYMSGGTEISIRYVCRPGVGEYIHKEFNKEYGRDFNEFNPTDQDKADYEELFGGTIEEAVQDYNDLAKLGPLRPTEIQALSKKMDYDVFLSMNWEQVTVSKEID